MSSQYHPSHKHMIRVLALYWCSQLRSLPSPPQLPPTLPSAPSSSKLFCSSSKPRRKYPAMSSDSPSVKSRSINSPYPAFSPSCHRHRFVQQGKPTLRIGHHLSKGEVVGFPLPPAVFQRMYASLLLMPTQNLYIALPRKIIRSKWSTEIVASFSMNGKP